MFDKPVKSPQVVTQAKACSDDSSQGVGAKRWLAEKYITLGSP